MLKNLTSILLICIALASVLSACSLSDKDKDRVVEVGEIIEVGAGCIDLEGSEWMDCMMEDSESQVEEAIEKDISPD